MCMQQTVEGKIVEKWSTGKKWLECCYIWREKEAIGGQEWEEEQRGQLHCWWWISKIKLYYSLQKQFVSENKLFYTLWFHCHYWCPLLQFSFIVPLTF